MPKKVLQLIRLAQGGMKEHFFNLLNNLDKKDFMQLAAGPFSLEEMEKLQDKGIPVYYLPLLDKINPVKEWHSLQKLSHILQKEKIDLLHMHGSRAALLGQGAAKIAKTKTTVFTMHNFVLDNYSSQWRKRLGNFLEKQLILSAQKTITVSQALARELVQKRHIQQNRIITIYNGIDLNSFQPTLPIKEIKHQLGLGKEQIVIGTVSRLIPEKGIDYLIQSAEQLRNTALFPQLTFLIVGEGPFRPVLEKMVLQLNLQKKVVFTGYRKDIGELLKVIDIFVLPSLSEGLGIALLEAMAMGKPVIGTEIGGIPEIIINEKNGYLIPPANPQKLAERILLLASETRIREEMGREGKKTLRNKFTLQQMVDQTAKVYQSLLE